MHLIHGAAVRRLLTAAAVGAAVVLGAAAPANAVVLDTDRPKITLNGFDFGRNWDSFGAPLNGGHLYWDVTNGDVNPNIEGYLYLKNVASSCAKIEVEYHDAAHHALEVDSSPEYCADTDSKEEHWINIDDYESPYITHVIVRLRTQGTNGSWSTAGSQTWNLGTD